MKKFLARVPKDWWIISGVFAAVTFIFYVLVTLVLKGGVGTVYKNWDAPSYVMAAISLYDPQIAFDHNIIASPLVTPTWTFLPAHFPLYPILIRIFSFVGYFRASMLLSIFFALLTLIAFYEFVRRHRLARNPLMLTLPLILLTPRWFAVYHTGSTEPLFLFFMINAVSEFLTKRPGRASIWASLTMLTRPQGALLGLAFAVMAILEVVKTKNLMATVRAYVPYLLIPASLLGVFIFYYVRTGDFFAFFPAISAFGHYTGSIFPTFNFPAPNIETFWQEVNVYDYVIVAAACLMLLRKNQVALAVISTVLFVPLIFIGHTDISRYALPVLPFVFIAFAEIIETKEFVLGTFLMSPAVMLYTINFMAFNHGS